LDIAHFGIEISDRPDDKTLADWVRKFHRSLALQDPTLCAFGSKLLNECVEFRANDANRKRIPKDSIGIHRKDMESTTDHIITEHNKTKEEDKIKREPLKRFQAPTVSEISIYCSERKNQIDPEKFWAYYESNGWRVGKNPMKSWKAAITTWEKGSNHGTNKHEPFKSKSEREWEKLQANLGLYRTPGDGEKPNNQFLSLG
jgi:hypothetical protein